LLLSVCSISTSRTAHVVAEYAGKNLEMRN